MPSIELEGHSDARFALIDGKIVRLEAQAPAPGGGVPAMPGFDRTLRE